MGSGWPGGGYRMGYDPGFSQKGVQFGGYYLSLIGCEILAELLLVREGARGLDRQALEQQVRNLVVMYEGAVLSFSRGSVQYGSGAETRSRDECSRDLVNWAVKVGMLRRRPVRVVGDEVRAWLAACKLALSRED